MAYGARWMVVTRRRLGRSALAAAGLAGGGAFLAAAPAVGAARPVRGSQKVVVVWAPWHDSVPYGPELVGLFQEAVQPFLASHPGLEVRFSPNCCDYASLIAAAFAGEAPDVTQQYRFGPLSNAGIMLDLTPYVRKWNVDLGLFSQGRVDHWRSPQGLFGLPSYTNVYGTIINLGILDELGLAYPPQDWTYLEATALWRQATRKGSKATVGGKVMAHANAVPSAFYLYGWGTPMVDPATRTRCLLDTPEAIACGEWWNGVVFEGIATTYGDGSCFPYGLQNTPPTVVETFGTCDMPDIASKLRGLKWDLWPMPSFPKGRFTVAGPDSYMITATTRNPEAAWELLYWATVEPTWQRWQMRTLLGGPVLNDLWPEYTAVLQQVAPPLRGKNLAVIGASSADIRLRTPFRYEDPTAQNIINNWGTKISKRQVSVAEGYREAARQVNALEAEAAAGASALAARLAGVEAALGHAAAAPGAVALPAPSLTGAGSPPVKAPAALSVRGGTYTLVGTGSNGISGGNDAGYTIACLPFARSRGSFTCRVVSAMGLGAAPGGGAKVGLLAAGDLSSSSALVAVEVSTTSGLHVQTRSLPEMGPGDQRNLLPALPVASSPAEGKNYLLRPVWLRLVRDVARWSAYASLDGQRWTQVGSDVGAEMTGAWVGIFATPHAGPPARLQAVFDNLSFTPQAVYQVGS